MQALRDAFPDRPLKVRYRPIATAATYFGVVFIVLGLAYMGPEEMGSLIEKYKVNQHPVLVRNVDVVVTERSKYTTLAQLRYTYDGLEYSVIKAAPVRADVGDRSTRDIYISAQDPTLVTYRLGWSAALADSMWPLFIHFGLLLALALSVPRLVRDELANRRARRRNCLTPVVVGVGTPHKAFFRLQFPYFSWLDRSINGIGSLASFKTGDGPLLLPIDPSTRSKNSYQPAIGLRIPGLKTPILMDKDLRRIDMTDEERARFLLAVEQTKSLPADEFS